MTNDNNNNKDNESTTTNKKQAVRIAATIYVERDTQKGIIIGQKGAQLKQIGTVAREHIEHFLQDHSVYLELHVKVMKDWRKKEDSLKQFGYLSND